MNIVEERETDIERRLRPGRAGMVSSLLVALAVPLWSADDALSALLNKVEAPRMPCLLPSRLPETVRNFT